jgi:hypothetical protein
MTIVIQNRFASAPQPPAGLGGAGEFAVIVIGSTKYELRRGALPNTYLLLRVGAAYETWVGGGASWSCTCPSATFRRERPCKHARAVAALVALFGRAGDEA